MYVTGNIFRWVCSKEKGQTCEPFLAAVGYPGVHVPDSAVTAAGAYFSSSARTSALHFSALAAHRRINTDHH